VSSNRIDSLTPSPSFVIPIFFRIEIIFEYSYILHTKVKRLSDDYIRILYLSFVLKKTSALAMG